MSGPNTLSAFGLSTGPVANAIIATITAPRAGYYQLDAMYYISGTGAAVDSDNVGVYYGGTLLAVVLQSQNFNGAFPRRMYVQTDGATDLTLRAIAGATGTAIYHASILATLIGS